MLKLRAICLSCVIGSIDYAISENWWMTRFDRPKKPNQRDDVCS